jgi:glycosyltransferase involved in cell wall biosynthesis
LPVLGSRYSQAVEDLVDDGSTGWIFAPDNVIELDGAIERALQSSNDLLHSMGQRARQAVGRVSPDSGADAILLAINYVLSSSPTG